MMASSSDTASITRSTIEIFRRSSSWQRSRPFRTVAGVDVAYGGDRYWSVLATFVDGQLDSIEEDRGLSRDRYVSSLFFLKEAPLISRLVHGRRIDLLFVNGHGICHPYRYGLATVVGITHRVPTIGVARRLIQGDYGREASCHGEIELITQSGCPTAAAVRLKPGGAETFVSPGYGLTLARAIAEHLGWLRAGKLPEPLRIAHVHSRRMRREEGENRES
jgi:deoxyribonuclease V